MWDLIIIIIVILLIFGIYKLITNVEENKNIFLDESLCNLENFDIDDMYIIKRGKEYKKYIETHFFNMRNKFLDKF